MHPSTSQPSSRYLFGRPRNAQEPTRFLFVNCGPGLGISEQQVCELFAPFGDIETVVVPSPTSFFSFVVFHEGAAATAAVQALHGSPTPGRASHVLTVKYSEAKAQSPGPEHAPLQPAPEPPLFLSASDTGIPGLLLIPDFISREEEQQLLHSLGAQCSAAAEALSAATTASLNTTAELPKASTLGPGTASGPSTGSTSTEGSSAAAAERGGGCGEQAAVSQQAAAGDDNMAAHVLWEKVARRRVCHFGFKFDYASRSFSASLGPLPPMMASLASRVGQLPSVNMGIDQVTVNEYPPGVGLAPHIDTHFAFTGPIVSLSLGSHCTMELRQGPSINNILTAPAAASPADAPCTPAACKTPGTGTDSAAAGPAGGSATGRVDGVAKASCSGTEAAVSDRRTVQLFLPPRSLLVMSGESRYGWQHGITSRKWDDVEGNRLTRGTRVSITLRKVRGFACDCAYPNCCDSQAAPLAPSRLALQQQQQQQDSGAGIRSCSTSAASQQQGPGSGERPAPGADPEAPLKRLEEQHVVQVYDAIATHFSATRFAIWPKVREFMEALPKGAVVADVGCGNGKYFGVRDDVAVLGSDRTPGLAEVASKRLRPTGVPGSHFAPDAPPGADVFVADALALPFRPGSCDAALCIAVLHHMSSVGRRLQLLQQLLDLLRPGGRALVTVWAMEQEDMAKTVHKWTRIPNPELLAGAGEGRPAGEEQEGQPLQPPTQGQSTGEYGAEATGLKSNGTGAATGGDSGGDIGGDFMVPWHLPCHRAEAQRMIRAGGPAKVDAGKGAVVLQRYYHLFTEPELKGLVAQLPNARAVDCFYDKSNWCIVFERTAKGLISESELGCSTAHGWGP